MSWSKSAWKKLEKGSWTWMRLTLAWFRSNQLEYVQILIFAFGWLLPYYTLILNYNELLLAYFSLTSHISYCLLLLFSFSSSLFCLLKTSNCASIFYVVLNLDNFFFPSFFFWSATRLIESNNAKGVYPNYSDKLHLKLKKRKVNMKTTHGTKKRERKFSSTIDSIVCPSMLAGHFIFITLPIKKKIHLHHHKFNHPKNSICFFLLH